MWSKNHEKLLPIIKNSPILFEIESLSQNLANISNIGIEALDILNNKKGIDPEWMENARNIVKEAKKPIAQTELMVVTSIEKILDNLE